MSTVIESRLASLEERFLAFIESVPDAMVLSDRNGRIVLVNSNTERLFGYSRDELVGKKIEILMPARFRKDHPGHRADYYADPQIRPMEKGRELPGLRKDGSEFLVEINLSPVEVDGEVLIWSAIRDGAEKDADINRVRIALKEHGLHPGLISVCAWCKRIRDGIDSWKSMEEYFTSHSDAKFTHGMCKDCLRKLDPISNAA